MKPWNEPSRDLAAVALLASPWLLLKPHLTPDGMVTASLLALGAVLVLWRTSIHLLWALAAGAFIGGMGWV